jgi:hypothetical protein
LTSGWTDAQCGASYYILFSKKDQIKQHDIGGAHSEHQSKEKYTKNNFGRTEGKYHFDRLYMNGRVILKWTEKTYSVKGKPVFIWLITKTTGGFE